MSSKRVFSWQKRHSQAEPYYKTGGLVPIDTLGNESSTDHEVKDTQEPRRRPSHLSIISPDFEQFASTPLSPPYNAHRVSSASNLVAMFNDMLRSPASSVGWPRSTSVHKTLPTRPRSTSDPSTPDLPVELPGSLLQYNQGYPFPDTPYFSPGRPVSWNIRRGTHPPGRSPEHEGDVLDLLHLFPEPLNHSKSFPSLHEGYQGGAMMSLHTSSAAKTSSGKSSPSRYHQRGALSSIEWLSAVDSRPIHDSNVGVAPQTAVQDYSLRESKKPLIGSNRTPRPSPTLIEPTISNDTFEGRASRRDDLGASLTPAPTTSLHKPAKNAHATIACQDQTIATLRSKFSGLRSRHEAHASAHANEVASLRNHVRLLEEQLAQHPGLHHVSNDLPFLLDRSESCSTPSRESWQHTAGTTAGSTLSFRSDPEKQRQSSRALQDRSEMESLKRKLSTTRRPSTADRNLLPELNQYKQNNAALQTQISSLMAKLNESKKSEKALRATLQDVEQRCTETESKASEAQQLASSAEALQNTIDYLENRLEIANTEKLDAQEELFNMRALKSPFDASFPDFQAQDQNAHESVDTVFSVDLRPSLRREPANPDFVAHIEQLEYDIRQKDACIADLEGDNSLLRQMLERVHHQCDEINLQLDIQNELLGKRQETDVQIEQLRTAVLEREAVIGEKETSVRAVERQLEHHKLLLRAEIRKHATTSRYLVDEADPLPELTALATKKDIDRWIQKLNQRLRKAKPMTPVKAPMTETEALFEDLRNEIDFYVREIIYYKLDIRGYKSDIKKLNRIAAQLGSYGNRASDLDSDTSSLRPAPTPSRARFLATTPEMKSSRHPSPALTSNVTANMGSSRVLTPPLSSAAVSTNNSPIQNSESRVVEYEEAASRVPILPRTPTKVTIVSAPHTTPTLQDTQHNADMPLETQEQLLALRPDDHSEMLALAMGNPRPLLHPYADPAVMTLDDVPETEREDLGVSTIRPVIPKSKFSQDLRSRSPSRNPSQKAHSRVGSASSNLSFSLQSQMSTSRSERKLSASSNTGIPFVMAMGFPHNPAIAVAAKNKPVTRSQRNSSTTLRTGIDGTMASSTPLLSPISIDGIESVPTAASPAPTGHKRKLSLSFGKQENESPITPTHTRSLSGGSIRTAIRWTKTNSKGKENELQVRQDSVQPLGNPV